MPILIKAPKIKQLSDIPPVGTGKGVGPEEFLSRELVALVNGVAVKNATWPQRAGNFEALGGEGSDNHGQMASAAWYLADPARRIQGRTAAEFWRQCAAWQLGEKEGAPGDAGLFQLSEPTSNDYDGYTVGGSWCAVWDRALKTGDAETAAAMEKLVTTWAAMVSLMSTWPTAGSFVLHGLDGDKTLRNPSRTLSRCSAGARSTNAHLHVDPAALVLTDLIRFPGTHPQPDRDPWDFWYLQITARRAVWLPERVAADMRAVIADHDLAAAGRVAALIPSSARWKGDLGIEIRRWEDGTVAGIVAASLNDNTSWLPASIVVPGQPGAHCWPWPKPKSPNSSSCRVVEEEGKIFVSTGFGRVSPLTLPATPPARVYRFCSRGLEIQGRGGNTPVPDPPKPVESPASVDLEAVAKIVENLRLSNPQRELQRRLVAELRSSSPRPLAEIAADLESFKIGAGQIQAQPWREAIRMLQEG
jgi:hypothetical protein